MSRFIRISMVVILVVGWGATFAAGAWRSSLRLTAEEISTIPERLAAIPLVTGTPTFRGTRDYIEQKTVTLSGADHYAAIDYVAEDGGNVRLHVGAAARTDAWLHEPTVCLPAHGWTEIETVRTPIWTGLEGVRPNTDIWRMTLRNGRRRMMVYYWLQYGSEIITNRRERSWIRLGDLLDGHRDRPIQIVILYAPLDRGEAKTEARVESLVRSLWPELAAVLAAGD